MWTDVLVKLREKNTQRYFWHVGVETEAGKISLTLYLNRDFSGFYNYKIPDKYEIVEVTRLK